jgi:hypothetical protein
MKQKILKFMRFLRDKIPKRTKKITIFQVEVPMTCNSREDKDDIIISTINHLEQTIKIKKNG